MVGSQATTPLSSTSDMLQPADGRSMLPYLNDLPTENLQQRTQWAND